ncbi:MAG: hypothetical protein CM15mP59_3090 [Flavobacteriaceae bacterium]|nr:MAG: hypothetical protein CM15mP59_3090 [Flavobacteriaceae bacterium]
MQIRSDIASMFYLLKAFKKCLFGCNVKYICRAIKKSVFDQNIAIIVDAFRVKGVQDSGRLSVVFDSHKAKIYDMIFH